MFTIIRKKYYITTCLALGTLLLIVYSFLSFKMQISFVISRDDPTKFILYYTRMFGEEDFYLGLGSKPFENCSYKNCFATHNRSLRPLDEYSALVFHGPEFRNSEAREIHARSSHQVYIYDNQESPLNTPAYQSITPNFFNWTMTYRMDSDILRTYGYVLRQQTDYKLPRIGEIDKKKNRIAWFVSNCITHSRREDLAEEIGKHYPVDIYGSCGNLSCSKRIAGQCYDMIEKDYKYYFSAENSLCDDYLTEKIYNILKSNVVPLVYGGARYDILTPPHSVIDVSDFETVQALASHLKFLDANPLEYLKYFEWKKRFVIDTTSEVTLCSLCEKLHKPLNYKSYEDISTWWFGDNFSLCKYGNKLPKIVRKLKTKDV